MHTRFLRVLASMLLFSLLTATAPSGVLLKAHYRQVPRTDPEYAQGAVEKNDLAHREVEPMTWLILVDEPADPDDWRHRLDSVTDPKHGSWSVTRASAEEVEAGGAGKV